MLWPPTCVLCADAGAAQLDLCAGCHADLPRNDACCTACAEPLPAGVPDPALCGACLRHPPPFARSRVPYRYGYPLDHLVRRLKFQGDLVCGRVLGTALARHLLGCARLPLPEIIVPVPLAARRFRERGFNQALELARPVGRLAHLPVCSDLVARRRETAEQSALDAAARRTNLHDAFVLLRPLPATHVAIVDDVITTGSTVRELAKTLRRAGAARIEVWAVARAGEG